MIFLKTSTSTSTSTTFLALVTFEREVGTLEQLDAMAKRVDKRLKVLTERRDHFAAKQAEAEAAKAAAKGKGKKRSRQTSDDGDGSAAGAGSAGAGAASKVTSGGGKAAGVCFAFQKGSCTRGDGCRFSHDLNAPEGKSLHGVSE